MPQPVFFLEHHVAFKIEHVFDQLAFRYNLQLMLSSSLVHLLLRLSIPDITIPRASTCFLAVQYVNLRNVLCDMAHTKVLSGWGKRWQVCISLGKWNLLILRRDLDTKVEEILWRPSCKCMCPHYINGHFYLCADQILFGWCTHILVWVQLYLAEPGTVFLMWK